MIPKHERRFTGFDDKIVAMYARGMKVREIQGFLTDQYGTEVSPEFISSVSAEAALEALNDFERSAWGQKFPTVTAAWRRTWDRVIPFFAFPPAVRVAVRKDLRLAPMTK